MDQAERKDTAQHALVYVGIAVAVVVILVLLWYAIDVVLLAFVGVLAAILLRAPADWLSERFGWREGWSLALRGAVLLGVLIVGGVLGRGILAQALALVDRIPEIVEGFRQELGKSDVGKRLVALADTSGMFSSGGVQVLGRGLGLIGSTFGVVANVMIVAFFAVFMAAQPHMYVEGALHLFARKKRERMREVLYEIGRVLRRWLVGQTALAVCVAILTGAGLILEAPFPFALALLAGLMEFVPYIGPFLAAIPAVMVGSRTARTSRSILARYSSAYSSWKATCSRRSCSSAVHLPPAAILFAQVLMGAIVGALGVAVATLLAAAVMVAVGCSTSRTRSATRTPRGTSAAPNRCRSTPGSDPTRRGRRAIRRGTRPAGPRRRAGGIPGRAAGPGPREPVVVAALAPVDPDAVGLREREERSLRRGAARRARASAVLVQHRSNHAVPLVVAVAPSGKIFVLRTSTA